MRLFIVILLSLGLAVTNSFSQFGLPGKLKEKVEEKIEKKVDEKIDEEVDGKKKEEDKTDEKKADENQNTVQTQSKDTQLKMYSKCDFVPGEKIIYFEDFANAPIGEFPPNWNTNGTAEVITLNKYSGNWLKMVPGRNSFMPEIKGEFPENYTIEFDIIPIVKNDNMNCITILIFKALPDERLDQWGEGGFAVRLATNGYYYFNWKSSTSNPISSTLDDEYYKKMQNNKIRISIMVNKQRVRFWADGKKIFDIPKLNPSDIVTNAIRFDTWDCGVSEETDYYPAISNIRIAVGTVDTRSKLMTEGKLVTNGIYFDKASDKIQPESYATIKSIANVLTENPTVNVLIVGHTDSDGNAASNVTLSQKRAESVKNFLVSEFKINASRLTTDGKGASEPIATNDTQEGKASNRRVEFIKK